MFFEEAREFSQRLFVKLQKSIQQALEHKLLYLWIIFNLRSLKTSMSLSKTKCKIKNNSYVM